MQNTFVNDISEFVENLKRESKQYQGQRPFEQFMKGLSDGSVNFRWRFGGRLTPSYLEESEEHENMPVRYALSAPFIYGMVIPIVFLDLCVSLYQAICFRLWKVPQVERRKHLVIDRQYLGYLKGYQKLNCAYCGYATGVFNYARAIAAKTEHYWCPLKHKLDPPDAHDFYIEFADYNDPDGWAARKTNDVKADN